MGVLGRIAGWFELVVLFVAAIVVMVVLSFRMGQLNTINLVLTILMMAMIPAALVLLILAKKR